LGNCRAGHSPTSGSTTRSAARPYQGRHARTIMATTAPRPSERAYRGAEEGRRRSTLCSFQPQHPHQAPASEARIDAWLAGAGSRQITVHGLRRTLRSRPFTAAPPLCWYPKPLGTPRSPHTNLRPHRRRRTPNRRGKPFKLDQQPPRFFYGEASYATFRKKQTRNVAELRHRRNDRQTTSANLFCAFVRHRLFLLGILRRGPARATAIRRAWGRPETLSRCALVVFRTPAACKEHVRNCQQRHRHCRGRAVPLGIIKSATMPGRGRLFVEIKVPAARPAVPRR
jgi:hypothetical protein